MLKSILGLLLFGAAQSKVYFSETFQTDPFESNRWVISNTGKEKGEAGKWEWTGGLWGAGDRKGLRTTEDAKFYAVSALLPEVMNNKDKTLAFGFRVKHEQKMDCGGGYAKLLGKNIDQKNFDGNTPYAIMMGPDICGYSTKKVHAIFSHEKENLLKKEEVPCPDDEWTHDYTLVVHPNETYLIYVDGEEKATGPLKGGWDFEKPQKIKDPKAKKPEDWIDEEMMDDPKDKKPEDWDKEPQTIHDPDATKPDDWDDEEDGEWEAPKIDNPAYKGPWSARRIKNPGYKGDWIHPLIDNPDFKVETKVHERGDIGSVGIEVWQVKSGTVFSDFVLADSYEDVRKFFEDNVVNIDDEKAAKKQWEGEGSPRGDDEAKEDEKKDEKKEEKTDEEKKKEL